MGQSRSFPSLLLAHLFHSHRIAAGIAAALFPTTLQAQLVPLLLVSPCSCRPARPVFLLYSTDAPPAHFVHGEDGEVEGRIFRLRSHLDAGLRQGVSGRYDLNLIDPGTNLVVVGSAAVSLGGRDTGEGGRGLMAPCPTGGQSRSSCLQISVFSSVVAVDAKLNA